LWTQEETKPLFFSNNSEDDVVYLNTDDHDKEGPHTWIGDTGASCHLTNSDDGMYDVEVIKSPIKIENGKIL
jgi:hypothetical protein